MSSKYARVYLKAGIAESTYPDRFYLLSEADLQIGIGQGETTASMRCFFPQELMALCQLNGLEVVRRFGDYDQQPFGRFSPKQILVCRCR